MAGATSSSRWQERRRQRSRSRARWLPRRGMSRYGELDAAVVDEDGEARDSSVEDDDGCTLGRAERCGRLCKCFFRDWSVPALVDHEDICYRGAYR